MTLTLALPRPFPEDRALFSEVDLVLTEIRRCYTEMDRFWTEEISRAIEALKTRCVDPTDFERWKNFQANLKHAIESWKVQYDFLFLCGASLKHLVQNELPSGGAQTLRGHNTCPAEVCSFSLPLWHPLRLTVRRNVTSEQ